MTHPNRPSNHSVMIALLGGVSTVILVTAVARMAFGLEMGDALMIGVAIGGAEYFMLRYFLSRGGAGQ